jgi:O-antigen ligase
MVAADAIGSLRTPQEMIRLQLLFGPMVIIFWQLPRMQAMGYSLAALHTSDVAGMLSVPAFIGVLARGKQWRILHVVTCIFWALSTSSGSMVAVIGGVAVSLMLMRGRAAGVGMFLIGSMFLAPALFPQKVTSVVFFGKNETNIRTATGRLPIWQWILEERVAAKPVLGFGFGDGEVQARLYNVGGFRMMHMHNGFMSALVNLGICGALLWALMWGAMSRAAWNIRQSKARIVIIGALVTLFLNSLSVETVTAPLTMPWIGHAMFFAMLAIATWETEILRERGGVRGVVGVPMRAMV